MSVVCTITRTCDNCGAEKQYHDYVQMYEDTSIRLVTLSYNYRKFSADLCEECAGKLGKDYKKLITKNNIKEVKEDD